MEPPYQAGGGGPVSPAGRLMSPAPTAPPVPAEVRVPLTQSVSGMVCCCCDKPSVNGVVGAPISKAGRLGQSILKLSLTICSQPNQFSAEPLRLYKWIKFES